jgi:two-component system response regulator TctD
MRLLLVEDNAQLSDWLGRLLRRNGYTVDCVADGEDADHLLSVQEYALVILDLSLPNMGGMQVLKRLRSRGNSVPVIILTANASLDGRVAGLDAGADDYLAKPFEMAELEARIRVQLRRAADRSSPEVRLGDLGFDAKARQFHLKGELLALTPREHAVLEQLLFKSGQTVSKQKLSEAIFDFDDETDPSAIEIYVYRLRKKLEGSNVRIATLRGLGYLLSHDEGAGKAAAKEPPGEPGS